ncbi:hypothetical protein CJF31_00008283 [Rutstroemia sp. NJR-2017a BVV2]|nr:hypothetical protein CJF31_00008283 [Rutstroemia sp. NJR-2017a BVV2]
MISLDI